MERYRTTLIMAALLVVLGAVAMFVTNQNKGATPGATPTPVPSYMWEESGIVQGIDIVSGTLRVSLRKDISTTLWMLTEPEPFPADTFQIENVASTLQRIEATKVQTGTTDLAQFGLDKASMTVTVTFSSTTPLTRTINIGASNFDGSSYYVKQPDSPDVYLTSMSPIGIMRNWLTSPPRQAPTPTPFPTAPPTPTSTATAQASPAGPVGPPGGNATATVGASPAITGTVSLVAPPTIDATVPGASNPTTPQVATSTATVTP